MRRSQPAPRRSVLQARLTHRERPDEGNSLCHTVPAPSGPLISISSSGRNRDRRCTGRARQHHCRSHRAGTLPLALRGWPRDAQLRQPCHFRDQASVGRCTAIRTGVCGACDATAKNSVHSLACQFIYGRRTSSRAKFDGQRDRCLDSLIGNRIIIFVWHISPFSGSRTACNLTLSTWGRSPANASTILHPSETPGEFDARGRQRGAELRGLDLG